eukprot:CFRG8308T1
MSQNEASRRQSSQPSEKKILVNFYSKVSQIIAQSRMCNLELMVKTNMWFNIGIMNAGSIMALTEPWTGSKPDLERPMNIEVAIDASSLASTQVLLLNRKAVAPNPHYVVLEQWSLSIDRNSGTNKGYKEEVAEFYKRLIIMIRSLCAYTHIAPAYRAYRRQKASKMGGLKLVCRFTSSPLIPQELGIPNAIGRLTIGEIQTPNGLMQLNVAYRQKVDLTIGEHEELLSSQFIENYFNRDQTRINARSAPLQHFHSNNSNGSQHRFPSIAEVEQSSEPDRPYSPYSSRLHPQSTSNTKAQHPQRYSTSPHQSPHPFSPTEDTDYFTSSPQVQPGSYIPSHLKQAEANINEAHSRRAISISKSDRREEMKHQRSTSEAVVYGSSVPIETTSYVDMHSTSRGSDNLPLVRTHNQPQSVSNYQGRGEDGIERGSRTTSNPKTIAAQGSQCYDHQSMNKGESRNVNYSNSLAYPHSANSISNGHRDGVHIGNGSVRKSSNTSVTGSAGVSGCTGIGMVERERVNGRPRVGSAAISFGTENNNVNSANYHRKVSSPSPGSYGPYGISVPVDGIMRTSGDRHSFNTPPNMISRRSPFNSKNQISDEDGYQPQLSFGMSPEPKDELGNFLKQLDASQNTVVFQNDPSSSVFQLTEELSKYREMAGSFLALSTLSPTGFGDLSMSPKDPRRDTSGSSFTPDLPFGSPSPTNVPSSEHRFMF